MLVRPGAVLIRLRKSDPGTSDPGLRMAYVGVLLADVASLERGIPGWNECTGFWGPRQKNPV